MSVDINNQHPRTPRKTLGLGSIRRRHFIHPIFIYGNIHTVYIPDRITTLGTPASSLATPRGTYFQPDHGAHFRPDHGPHPGSARLQPGHDSRRTPFSESRRTMQSASPCPLVATITAHNRKRITAHHAKQCAPCKAAHGAPCKPDHGAPCKAEDSAHPAQLLRPIDGEPRSLLVPSMLLTLSILPVHLKRSSSSALLTRRFFAHPYVEQESSLFSAAQRL